MVKKLLKDYINSALAELSVGVNDLDYVIETPHDTKNGDYATNVAIILSKIKNKNPHELAEEIKSKIKPHDCIEKVEIAGAGFINFYLSREFITENTNNAQRKDYGKNNLLSGKKVIVEYTDPNPFKEFHIGHLMSNAIGESISRLLEFSGAEVKRANYQGDVGMHVAKAVWGLINGENDFGRAYTKGALAFENDEKRKQEIKELNKKIYEQSDTRINELYKNGKEKSLAKFEEIYKKLGTKFDFYFFESESGPIGIEIVKKNTGTVFEESEGAIIYRGEKAGLHTRVFITKDGLPTYEGKELGLAEIKNKKYKSDISVVVTGNEVKDYYRVVRSAMKEIPEFVESENKIVHIPHGMLRLPSGKMSSRTGEVITAEALLGEVSEKLKNKISDEELLNTVSVGAVKYSLLKQEAGKDIIFDFEKSLSFTGDSGPYLQYTHARCLSLLEKAKSEGIKISDTKPVAETLLVERKLLHFSEVVEKAIQNYAPHHIANYLHGLASVFNTFYSESQIVEKDNPESGYKLLVTNTVAETLKKGLYVLGIKAPEVM